MYQTARCMFCFYTFYILLPAARVLCYIYIYIYIIYIQYIYIYIYNKLLYIYIYNGVYSPNWSQQLALYKRLFFIFKCMNTQCRVTYLKKTISNSYNNWSRDCICTLQTFRKQQSTMTIRYSIISPHLRFYRWLSLSTTTLTTNTVFLKTSYTHIIWTY